MKKDKSGSGKGKRKGQESKRLKDVEGRELKEKELPQAVEDEGEDIEALIQRKINCKRYVDLELVSNFDKTVLCPSNIIRKLDNAFKVKSAQWSSELYVLSVLNYTNEVEKKNWKNLFVEGAMKEEGGALELCARYRVQYNRIRNKESRNLIPAGHYHKQNFYKQVVLPYLFLNPTTSSSKDKPKIDRTLINYTSALLAKAWNGDFMKAKLYGGQRPSSVPGLTRHSILGKTIIGGYKEVKKYDNAFWNQKLQTDAAQVIENELTDDESTEPYPTDYDNTYKDVTKILEAEEVQLCEPVEQIGLRRSSLEKQLHNVRDSIRIMEKELEDQKSVEQQLEQDILDVIEQEKIAISKENMFDNLEKKLSGSHTTDAINAVSNFADGVHCVMQKSKLSSTDITFGIAAASYWIKEHQDHFVKFLKTITPPLSSGQLFSFDGEMPALTFDKESKAKDPEEPKESNSVDTLVAFDQSEEIKGKDSEPPKEPDTNSVEIQQITSASANPPEAPKDTDVSLKISDPSVTSAQKEVAQEKTISDEDIFDASVFNEGFKDLISIDSSVVNHKRKHTSDDDDDGTEEAKRIKNADENSEETNNQSKEDLVEDGCPNKAEIETIISQSQHV